MILQQAGRRRELVGLRMFCFAQVKCCRPEILSQKSRRMSSSDGEAVWCWQGVCSSQVATDLPRVDAQSHLSEFRYGFVKMTSSVEWLAEGQMVMTTWLKSAHHDGCPLRLFGEF